MRITYTLCDDNNHFLGFFNSAAECLRYAEARNLLKFHIYYE